MSDKFPREAALTVARDLLRRFEGRCDKLVFAGSLRRRKAEVGDIEVLYIPKLVEAVDPTDLFGGKIAASDTDALIAEMLADGTLEKRLSVDGKTTFGPKNKLMVHKASGIPVDLFASSPSCWHVSLVIRTGGLETNLALTKKALELGYSLNAYGAGFTRLSDGVVNPMTSERAVFDFLRIPYAEPWERL